MLMKQHCTGRVRSLCLAITLRVLRVYSLRQCHHQPTPLPICLSNLLKEAVVMTMLFIELTPRCGLHKRFRDLNFELLSGSVMSFL